MSGLQIIVLLILLAPPQAGVEIRWVEYRQTGWVWETHPGPACQTDAQGMCQITTRAAAWPDGLVRGYLDLGAHGARPLIWPGGEFSVSVPVRANGQVVAALEASYDHLTGSQPPVVQPGGAPEWVRWLSLFLGLLVLSFAFFVTRWKRPL